MTESGHPSSTMTASLASSARRMHAGPSKLVQTMSGHTRLGADLRMVESVVLSHGYWDHAAGYRMDIVK
jgi:hypothetical protein